jgi:hypothetical protein
MATPNPDPPLQRRPRANSPPPLQRRPRANSPPPLQRRPRTQVSPLATRADSERTLYFAYGSNLHVAQMAERCPDSLFMGKATLPGFRWQINQRGVANVVEAGPRLCLEGLVYAVTAADRRALDRSEGVARQFYVPHMLTVEFSMSYPCFFLPFTGSHGSLWPPRPTEPLFQCSPCSRWPCRVETQEMANIVGQRPTTHSPTWSLPSWLGGSRRDTETAQTPTCHGGIDTSEDAQKRCAKSRPWYMSANDSKTPARRDPSTFCA